MLHMRPISEIEELTGIRRDTAVQKRAIRDALRDAPALALLRQRGYDLVTAEFPRSYATLPGVEVIDHGRVVQFERQVIYRSMLRYIIPTEWVSGQHRELVRDAFDDTRRVAAVLGNGPPFMFTHVLSPHTPVVFDRTGEPVEPECLPECDPAQVHFERLGIPREEFGAGYAAQTHYINTLVLNLVDQITSVRPNAVIVLFSDHGTRTELDDYSEWFNTFFAGRTPGYDGLFAGRGHAISIFPRLFNAYFGTDFDVPGAEQRHITPDGKWPLTVESWP